MWFRVVLSVLCLRAAIGQTIDDVVCPAGVTGWVRVPIPETDPIQYSTCDVGWCDPNDPNVPGGRIGIIGCEADHRVIQEILESSTPVIPTACGAYGIRWLLAIHCVNFVCFGLQGSGCGNSISDGKDGGDPQGDPTGGDPHVVETARGTSFCYGLSGNNNDIFIILQHAATGSSVEGTIQGHGPWTYRNITVRAPSKDVYIWQNRGGIRCSEDDNGGTGHVFTTMLQKGKLVRVDVGTDSSVKYTVFCKSRGRFLDCWITPPEMIGACGGIMCDFEKAITRVVDSPNGKDAICSNGNKVSPRLKSRLGKACYELKDRDLEMCMGPISHYKKSSQINPL